ncbi:MAG: hypothetical protein MR051_03705 [Lentisphaeria bacterium]|nr:hypothetical protein [Lentisphaeria bacterium]
MFFEDIVAGTPYRPESARRHNAVNRLLRGDAAAPPPKLPPERPFLIDVYNDSGTEIAAFFPVALNGAIRSAAPDQLPAWRVFPAENDRTPWALSTGPIPPSS